MDKQFLAHYPFTNDAKNFVAGQNIDLTYDLLEISKTRTVNALKNGQIPFIDTEVEEALTLEVSSYAVCRMIVSLLKSNYFISRYAIAEAKRASSYLKSDSNENVARIATEFGIVFNGNLMHVASYLTHTPKALEYKLINRQVSNGFVSLTRNEFIRVIEEAIKERIESSLPIDEHAIPEKIHELIPEIKRQLPQETAKIAIRPRSGDYAPCIKKLLEDLKNSINLPHVARWTLAVYLLNQGVDADTIVNIFKTAPDFSERVTRYQVEFAKKKAYKMPNCSVMMSYGLCIDSCKCAQKGFKNPLEYR